MSNSSTTSGRPLWWRAARTVVVLYLTWIGMLATHELGHVLHAWISGGYVVRIVFPPLGFSQTIVWPNPHERFVVWGGPIWGATLPALIYLAMRMIRRNIPAWLQFFVGFCLIANGAYIGVGWLTRSGDAADLHRLGTPAPLMVGVGLPLVVAGLMIWHRTPWLTSRRKPPTYSS